MTIPVSALRGKNKQRCSSTLFVFRALIFARCMFGVSAAATHLFARIYSDSAMEPLISGQTKLTPPTDESVVSAPAIKHCSGRNRHVCSVSRMLFGITDFAPKYSCSLHPTSGSFASNIEGNNINNYDDIVLLL